MAAKYVVIMSEHGSECVVAFSEMLSHSQIARKEDVISAGAISFGVDGVSCYGRSVTLGKDSRPEEDTWLANKQFFPSW
jgi:hypothetical protein